MARKGASKCHFCGESPSVTIYHIAWVSLWNGTVVFCCGSCYHTITEFQREQGVNLPHASQGKVAGGERKTKVEKGETGSDNIKVAYVLDKRITNFKIEDEGEIKEYEAKEEGKKPAQRLVIGVSYNGMRAGDPCRWSMNNKSRNALIDLWGDDTKSWVGKTVEIMISGDGEYQHLTVDLMRTK